MGHWIWETIKLATHIHLLIHPFFFLTYILETTNPCVWSPCFVQGTNMHLCFSFVFFPVKRGNALTVDLFPPDENEPPRLRALLFHSQLILRETNTLSEKKLKFILSPAYFNLARQLDHLDFNCKILLINLANF